MSSGFWVCFFIIGGGYLALNTSLQVLYCLGKGNESAWKLQPSRGNEVPSSTWWLPALNLLARGKAGRHRFHGLFATINILVSATVAGITGHLVAAGRTRAYWEEADLRAIVWGASIACIQEIILEYYWHRIMHLPSVYSTLHKYHHHYKAPEPFDDMFIHPLEALGFDLILFSPPYLWRLPVASLAVYMAIMGLCGMLDHCGIALRIPGVYDTSFHDNHHLVTNVNFGFPVPWMDWLHGTSQKSGKKNAKQNYESLAALKS